MRSYVIGVFDEFGQQVSVFEKRCGDDLAALHFGRSLASEHAIEIWDRGYRVARLNAASDVRHGHL